jgi:hypothetical protein
MAMPGFVEDTVALAKQAMQKNLHSGDAINKIGKGGHRDPGFLGGIPGSVINYRSGNSKGIMEAVSDAHKKKDGSWSPAAIAGSFMAAGVGYRAISGGGVYKDSNGNTNLAGVPFI